MTISELQQQIIDEIIRITSDMSMSGKDGELKRLKGYKQAIPIFTAYSDEPEEDGEDLFPYFVVRVDNITYHGENGNAASIMIMFAIYDEDEKQRGYYTLTSIMERVIMRFQKDRVLGRFFCDGKMAMQYQEDDSYPQFFGGIEMVWYLPEIEMEGLW
ncbi:hypothetical protein DWX10_16260 [Clostridium sp. AF18-27]|uniref:hypothetical protein n=1 Tax=Enterocloster lavalensis TaxID=460384 RepID=UPI000E4881BC|nr:hypothetical protein [Enterocloster lavalensis]RHR51971.1 hypothetical protein DWX10_16260 [Clostridium sp. AF18-27]